MGGTVRVTTSTLVLLATSLGYPALGATLSTAGVIASTLLSSTVRVPIPSLVALSSSVTGGLTCIAVRALGRALSLGVEVSSRAWKGYIGRQRGFGQWTVGVNDGLDALELVNEHRGVMESGGGRTSDMLHSTPLPPLSSGATCSTLCDALGSERQEDCQWLSIASSPPSGEGGVDEPEPSSKAPPLRAPPPPL